MLEEDPAMTTRPTGRSLEGQVAIVTGGGSGIGRAIADAFAGAGAAVVVAGRRPDPLEETVAAIEEQGGRAVAAPTDVTDVGQAEALVERAVATFGTLDVLVNNAGAAPFVSDLRNVRIDGFEKYFRLNYFGAVYVTKAAASVLLDRGSGCVLNVASIAGLTATPGEEYYGDAKAALIHFTRSLARAWAPAGVRVNALAPGWVKTAMTDPLRATDERNRGVLDAIPMGRWGRPEEIAGPALFLCSPASSFITGSVLVVDGGQTTGAMETLL
jgi:NAD(P)-dependent dehydrogenase (short-subunit alcohol dehydrogenase family)